MAHLHQIKQDYKKLHDRIDKSTVGMPDTPLMVEVLRLLWTEEEARLGSVMPVVPATAKVIAERGGLSLAQACSQLDRMAKKGLVFDMLRKDKPALYVLSPPVVGFFEFAMMRVRDDIPQREVAQRLHEAVFDSPAFAKKIAEGKTALGRAMIQEEAITDFTEVLDYERATAIVRDAKSASISLCYCRHKAEHCGHACEHPQEICMSLNGAADFNIRHGHGRPADKSEVLELLSQAKERGLVQTADNVKNQPNFICNCCGCCCGMLRALNQYGVQDVITTSNYAASPSDEKCNGCGLCARACPAGAIKMKARRPQAQKKRRLLAEVDEGICLGCGVCVRSCKKGDLQMKRRPARVLTPENTIDRAIRVYLNKGQLNHLLVDAGQSAGHEVLNRMLGAILALPPIKRALAKEQVQSRFVSFMLDTIK